MKLAILALLATAAWGQLQFNTFDGTTEAPIPNNILNLSGPFTVGVNIPVRVRVRNRTGVLVCLVRNPASLGIGFSLDPGNPDLPLSLAADAFKDFVVNFLPASVARSSSANFEIQYAALAAGAFCSGPSTPTNIVRADLIIQASNIVAGATVSLTPGGTFVTQVAFPNTPMAQASSIKVYLNNPSAAPITLPNPPNTPLDPKGAFTILTQPAFPLTLNPTESALVELQFSPPAVGPYTGTFAIGTFSVSLTGNGAAPPFSTPKISLEPALQSGLQAKLSITLDTPAPLQATGTLTMTFTPTAGTADDEAIKFVSAGARRTSFLFNPGDSAATIGVGTAKEVLFQTGTTAGTITFSADFQSKTVSAKTTIAPAPISIDNTIANRPSDSQLTIQLSGFDNSKSTGQLGFTFYDTAGVTVPPGRITVDAAQSFSQFYSQRTTGGLFSLLAQFPVKGSTAHIATADVDVTNTAGTTTLTKLRFSPCTPVVVVPCANVNGCPCQ